MSKGSQQTSSLKDNGYNGERYYILADYQIQQRESKLTWNYRQWFFCVQHQESDFNFISWLIEDQREHLTVEARDFLTESGYASGGQGKGDDSGSCWVRVSSSWAGWKYGGVQMPRGD